MSAFLMSNKNLSIITNQIKRDEINGYRMPYNLKDMIRGKREYEIFNMLSDLNDQAVCSRYGGTSEIDRRYFSTEELYKDSVYGDVMPWMYKFIKILDSFIYQCTEDGACETKLYEALQEYENNWYRYLVVNMPDYKDA